MEILKNWSLIYYIIISWFLHANAMDQQNVPKKTPESLQNICRNAIIYNDLLLKQALNSPHVPDHTRKFIYDKISDLEKENVKQKIQSLNHANQLEAQNITVELLKLGQFTRLDEFLVQFLVCRLDFKKLQYLPLKQIFSDDFMQYNATELYTELFKNYGNHIRNLMFGYCPNYLFKQNNFADQKQSSLNFNNTFVSNNKLLKIETVSNENGSHWELKNNATNELLAQSNEFDCLITNIRFENKDSMIVTELSDHNLLITEIPWQAINGKFSLQQLIFLIQLCDLHAEATNFDKRIICTENYKNLTNQLSTAFQKTERAIIKQIIERIENN